MIPIVHRRMLQLLIIGKYTDVRQSCPNGHFSILCIVEQKNIIMLRFNIPPTMGYKENLAVPGFPGRFAK